MSAILLTAGARLLADIVQRRRLMIDENGTYLGNCPSFPLDEHRCCISLNIAPSIGGLFFVLLACGCGIGWGLFYTVVEPVLWGVILAWTIEDDEPCLYIGLVVQVLLWLVVVHTTCRRLYRKWTGEDRSSGPQEMSEMSAAQEMSGSPGAGWPGAPDGAAGWPGADGGYYPEGAQPAPLPAPAAGGWPMGAAQYQQYGGAAPPPISPEYGGGGQYLPAEYGGGGAYGGYPPQQVSPGYAPQQMSPAALQMAQAQQQQAELQLATYRQQVQQQQFADEAAAAQLQLQQAETYRRAAQTYRQQSGGRPKLSDDYARAASTYRQASASRERREQERAAATHRQQAAFAAYEAAVTSRGIREEAAAETYRQVQAQAAAQAQQLAAQSYREPPPPQQYASYGAPPQEAYPPSIAGASEADDELDWPGDVDVMQAQQRL